MRRAQAFSVRNPDPQGPDLPRLVLMGHRPQGSRPCRASSSGDLEIKRKKEHPFMETGGYLVDYAFWGE